MKIVKSPPVSGINRCIVGGLMVVMSTSGLFAQESQAALIRRLQEENAALRAQTNSSSASPTRSSTAAASAEADTVILSPFEVNEAADYGYLKTNAVTATRIGAEIQNVPMSISVMSEEFIKDLGLKTINDVLRYSASGGPDGAFVMARPANSSTPQGRFTNRGFPMNSLLRNGVFRYVGHNLDNVDRVEIVKGPSAVFFGAGYPGGVINYVTKKPLFRDVPTTMSYSIDNFGGEKILFDQNSVFSKRAAFRLNAAWSDLNGDLKGEYDNYFSITPSLTIVPFDDGRLKMNFEFEHLERRQQESAWVDRNPQAYYDSYANPSADQIAASAAQFGGAATADAYRARIFNSPGNWVTVERRRLGDSFLPQIREITRGAKYLDASGNLITDKDFNFTNASSFVENNIDSFQATIDYEATEWLSARYTFTIDDANFDAQEGYIEPNADRRTFNAAAGGNTTGYYLESENHQLDLIFRAEALGMKHTFLVGANVTENFQRYNGNASNTTPIYWQGPGYNTPGLSTVTTQFPGSWGTDWNVPAAQYLTDRNGVPMSAQQVYSLWDPGVHVQPPVAKLFPVDRNLLDGYPTTNHAYYVNWQGKLMDDKLTLMAGYRYEDREQDGQHLVANDPWFAPPPNAFLDQAAYPPGIYNYSPGYAGDASNFNTLKDNSWMVGASFEVTPDVSVYATVSKTFLLNTGLQGGYTTLDINDLINAALANNPGGYDYYGTRITTLQGGLDALEAQGANKNIENEEGLNYEIGVKTALNDGKLTSTVSLFHATRKNQKIDDSETQQKDPYNYLQGAQLFGYPSRFGGANVNGTRNFRWRTVGIVNEITGTEFEVIWSPNRNYQALVNGSWLWQAETTENPTIKNDGSENAKMYYGNRIENVAEYRFNMVHKYTFSEGIIPGLSVNLGMRYSSETILSRSTAWNPDKGGFTAGDYLVWDLGASYPWEVLGHKVNSNLRINNVTDKYYFENNYIPSDGRSITLTTTLSF